MNTTRRGFLASVAAFFGIGAATKSGPAPQPVAPSLSKVGAPYPDSDSEVTFIEGPLNGLRRSVSDRALTVEVPCLRRYATYRMIYERSASNPMQFVYRGEG